ncbi:Vegetative incompatibility protein [Paramyrothecium foliicola]|nr:Vegetative incompatibility protein [Paramyrothecium foliicola]
MVNLSLFGACLSVTPAEIRGIYSNFANHLDIYEWIPLDTQGYVDFYAFIPNFPAIEAYRVMPLILVQPLIMTLIPAQPNRTPPTIDVVGRAQPAPAGLAANNSCAMRLINVKTLEIEEFFDIDTPPYAILSHTWLPEGEVTLGDWMDKRNRRFLPGYAKIEKACEETIKDNLEYLWVDTNCIDKSSSAELTEAINSMFKKSRWFTRGWTLQELIAPPVVHFYSHDWRKLGTKTELALPIAETTGVGLWCLLRGRLSKQNPLRGYSVAQRLCWASHRSTTRLEDQAYCLLGLFDINMPLVYGEGHEAFTRLLEEIVRKYADQSFLCSQLRYVDFLPRSPKDFDGSQHVVLSSSPRLKRFYNPVGNPRYFHMTNLGLEITLPLVETFSPDYKFGVLEVWDADSEINDDLRYISRIWLPLMRKGPGMFSRMLFPQTFFPVRLISRDTVMESAEADERSRPDAEDESLSKEVVDLISPDRAATILIKKSFAATVIVKKYQFEDAACPFLLCFPRGFADYRVYKIFPEEADTETHLHLSLVMSRRLGTDNAGTTRQENVDTEDKGHIPLATTHGVFVTFKRRQSKPLEFLTIFLANIHHVDKATKLPGYRPSCRILPGWLPTDESVREVLGNMDLRGLQQYGRALVSVQKIPYLVGKQVQSVGLTQVVFDLDRLRQEIQQSAPKEMAKGVFAHYGVEHSDEDEDVDGHNDEIRSIRSLKSVLDE